MHYKSPFSNVSVVSVGIKSVVDENNHESSGGVSDATCSACEMTVVWMQNQLKQNQTQERILDYVNQVKQPFHLMHIFRLLLIGLLVLMNL